MLQHKYTDVLFLPGYYSPEVKEAVPDIPHMNRHAFIVLILTTFLIEVDSIFLQDFPVEVGFHHLYYGAETNWQTQKSESLTTTTSDLKCCR